MFVMCNKHFFFVSPYHKNVIKMKTQRQRVTLWAWEFTRQHNYTWSQAMKAAWKEIKLRDLSNALSHQTVRVSFMKVNGERTTRMATRNSKLIPSQFAPKGSGMSKADNVITFFSLTDGGWRSFRSDNLITFQVA
jgi:hypothetical protein